MNGDQPVTHAVLQATLDAALDRQKNEFFEFVRQAETSLLTAFHSYARGQYARLHTMETIDNEIRLRMNALEDRVLALETQRPHSPPTA